MIEQQVKLDLFRDGLWCIADMGTEAYQNATLQSESKISSLSQQKIGKKVVYLYCVITFCFMLKRALYRYIDRTAKMTNYRNSTFIRAVHRIAALIRFISYRRFPSRWCTIFQIPSSLGCLLMILAGFLFVLCYLFIPKFWYRDCLGFGGGPLAIRGGHEAIALIPLIYILSGKTNFVTAFTGVSYEKLVAFHRWASFICCFCAWVHTVPFYLQPVWEGGRERLAWYERTHWTYYSGIPPLVFLTVLVLFSHSLLRSLWYELWLRLHWLCALGLYISLFYHCNGWTEGTKYMVATGAFWVFQVGWKTVSKEAFGFRKNGLFHANRCRMRRFPADDGSNGYFEMVIENSLEDDAGSRTFTWRPGQHCFVRVPGLRVLERHPFSIVSTCRPRERRQDVRLVIKAKGRAGMTRTLYEGIEADVEAKAGRVYVDGPYGGLERDVGAFTNVFLLSTGTGLTAVLPYFVQCCEYMLRSECALESVRSDWFVRSGEHVGWVVEELREVAAAVARCRKTAGPAQQWCRFRFNVYVKGPAAETETEVETVRALFDEMDAGAAYPREKEDEDGDGEDGEDTPPSVLGLHRATGVADVLDEVRRELGQGNLVVTSGTASLGGAVGTWAAGVQRAALRGGGVEEVCLHSESFDL